MCTEIGNYRFEMLKGVQYETPNNKVYVYTLAILISHSALLHLSITINKSQTIDIFLA